MSDKKKKLGRATTVDGKTWTPQDDVPAEVLEKITNPKAWIPEDEATAAAVDPDRPSGTSGGARLAGHVTVEGRLYGPTDTIPDEVAAKIRNPKAWEGGKLPNLSGSKTDKATDSETSSTAGAKKAAAPAAGDKRA